jgi:ornithine carbamoyltransferase
MTRHLTTMRDLSADDLVKILDLSEQFSIPQLLQGKGVALLFEKPSSRTRHSMEMAVVQLGGHPVTETLLLDERETVEDLVQVYTGYHAMIAARVFAHRHIDRMVAVAGNTPVINMLSDWEHPLQTLADLATLRREFGDLEGCRIAWVGEYNNVARSLAYGASLLGAQLVVASPEGYGPSEVEKVTFATNVLEAVDGAHAVLTDTWYSMGWEGEAEQRREVFRPFQVTESLMAHARPSAIFLHCLPAHRGEEVTNAVLDGPASRIFAAAHDRLHTARAALAFLLGVR